MEVEHKGERGREMEVEHKRDRERHKKVLNLEIVIREG